MIKNKTIVIAILAPYVMGFFVYYSFDGNKQTEYHNHPTYHTIQIEQQSPEIASNWSNTILDKVWEKRKWYITGP